MIQSVKKRALFFLSITISGLFGIVISHIRSNYSKDDSLLIPTAHANLAKYTWGYGGCGDGCGGCSSDGDTAG